MAYLPSTEAANLATKSDIAVIRSDIATLGQRIDEVNKRMDRLFLTLAAGLISMIGALFVQSFV